MSILDLLNGASMRCARCKAELPSGGDIEACGCWEKCSCGWTAEAGKQCTNPNTIRCTTKLKYGKWNPSTRRYDPKPERDAK